MKSIIGIGWFVLGLIQFAAIVNGFVDILGTFFGIVASFVLGEIPILGTIMGIRGAVNNWGWEILPAILLFIGAPIVIFLIGLISSRRS